MHGMRQAGDIGSAPMSRAHKVIRGLAFTCGCLALALAGARIAKPAPSLEMTAAPCIPRAVPSDTWSRMADIAGRFVAGDVDRLAGDWANLCRFRAANARLLEGPPPRLVMIGDSITDYWRLANPGMFEAGVANRGISGQTSAQILIRFNQDAVALRPRIVHIMAGLNDIAGVTGRASPDDFKNNMSAMLDIARANGIAVVLGSLTPASSFHGRPGLDPSRRIVELNGWLAATAKERGLVYADYHRVLADERGYPKREFDGDGSHPNSAGYAAMEPVLRVALAQAEERLKLASAGAGAKEGR